MRTAGKFGNASDRPQRALQRQPRLAERPARHVVLKPPRDEPDARCDHLLSRQLRPRYANLLRPNLPPTKSLQIRGALCRTRTDDPFLTMEVLYQLS
jgi:hypothetical protein